MQLLDLRTIVRWTDNEDCVILAKMGTPGWTPAGIAAQLLPCRTTAPGGAARRGRGRRRGGEEVLDDE